MSTTPSLLEAARAFLDEHLDECGPSCRHGETLHAAITAEEERAKDAALFFRAATYAVDGLQRDHEFNFALHAAVERVRGTK